MSASASASAAGDSQRSPGESAAMRAVSTKSGVWFLNEKETPHTLERESRYKVRHVRTKTKSRSKQNTFSKLFGLPDEALLHDFTCAIERTILLHGRMYLSINHLCFFSNIFGHTTKVVIPLNKIQSVQKRRTVKIFNNALEIKTDDATYMFRSFLNRGKAFAHLAALLQKSEEREGDSKRPELPVAGAESKQAGNGFAAASLAAASSPSASDTELDVPVADQPAPSSVSTRAELKERRRPEPSSSPQLAQPGSGTSASPARAAPSPMSSPPSSPSPGRARVGAGQTVFDSLYANVQMSEVVNTRMACSTRELFLYFFADEQLAYLPTAVFHRRVGDTEIDVSSWQAHPSLGGLTRDVCIRSKVKNAPVFAPKSTRIHKAQRYRFDEQGRLVLDVNAVSLDVPKGDAFSILEKWTVEDEGGPAGPHRACTVKVSLGVRFTKSVWGLQGMIKNRSKKDTTSAITAWLALANSSLEAMPPARRRSHDEVQVAADGVVSVVAGAGGEEGQGGDAKSLDVRGAGRLSNVASAAFVAAGGQASAPVPSPAQSPSAAAAAAAAAAGDGALGVPADGDDSSLLSSLSSFFQPGGSFSLSSPTSLLLLLCVLCLCLQFYVLSSNRALDAQLAAVTLRFREARASVVLLQREYDLTVSRCLSVGLQAAAARTVAEGAAAVSADAAAAAAVAAPAVESEMAGATAVGEIAERRVEVQVRRDDEGGREKEGEEPTAPEPEAIVLGFDSDRAAYRQASGGGSR